MFTKNSAVIIALLLAFATTGANARTIMTFEALAMPGAGYTIIPSPYTEAGFTITANNFCQIQSQNPDLYMGSTGLSNCTSNGTNTLTKVGGGKFTLSSIDLAPFGRSYGLGALVNFEGTKEDGSKVYAHFTAPQNYRFEKYTFSGFDNVMSVLWKHVFPYHQFDNITLNATQYLGVSSIPDADSDGKADQALLILKEGQYYLRIISGATGKQLKQVWLGSNLTPNDMTSVDKQVSILITKSDGTNTLQLRDSVTGALVKTIYLPK